MSDKRDEQWLDLWQHRATLIRMARRRLPCPDEAEDIASEAVLRAAARGIDPAIAGPWMNRVVSNLCADRRREASYDPIRVRYARSYALPAASVEDVVCSRMIDKDMLRRFDTLPARQRTATVLRADGHRVDCIADRLACSYKTVESLLSRARHTLRQA